MAKQDTLQKGVGVAKFDFVSFDSLHADMWTIF